MSTATPPASAIARLHGLKLFAASHAADMREFGFRDPSAQAESEPEEWFLHIQCPWRIESGSRIITGSFDWLELADQSRAAEGDWDPATGGSLQELKLREMLQDFEGGRRTIENRTGDFVVSDARVSGVGDLVIFLTGGLCLRVFPAGCTGEFWRVFKRGALDSHFVCEASSSDE